MRIDKPPSKNVGPSTLPIPAEGKLPPHHMAVVVVIRHPNESNPGGYMNAHTSHASRPGEDWQRGNDLCDGPMNPETLESIIAALRDVFAGRKV